MILYVYVGWLVASSCPFLSAPPALQLHVTPTQCSEKLLQLSLHEHSILPERADRPCQGRRGCRHPCVPVSLLPILAPGCPAACSADSMCQEPVPSGNALVGLWAGLQRQHRGSDSAYSSSGIPRLWRSEFCCLRCRWGALLLHPSVPGLSPGSAQGSLLVGLGIEPSKASAFPVVPMDGYFHILWKGCTTHHHRGK